MRYILKNNGFSYIGVLFLITIMGISISGASVYWSTIMKRERETDYLFKGHQIREAIRSYYENPPKGMSNQYPKRMADLLKDPRFPNVRRHLRKVYSNPLSSDGKWNIISTGRGRIKGVYTPAREVPKKVSGFLKDYEDFEKAKTYADWKFVFVPK